jgi:UDP-N-acetylmuramyl-tripeptide synthetase
VCTNFSHEHLDYHKTLESYFTAKERLFSELLPENSLAVLNCDNHKIFGIKNICKQRGHNIITVGSNNYGDIRLIDLRVHDKGSYFIADIFGQKYELFTPLFGQFQIHNILYALATVYGLENRNLHKIIEGVSILRGVRGRLEYVGCLPNNAKIYIDFAHKPDALERVLKTFKEMPGNKKITAVFGCGGNRDVEKRPMMGKIATQYADKVIVTDDNPRDEKPSYIRAQIMSGCSNPREIALREEAIHTAITELGDNDICIIAGKGHETGLIIKGQILPFDDKLIAETVIKSLGGTTA